MKRWVYCFLAVLALVVITQSTALSVYDAPHNETNNIYCGDCHGKSLNITGGSPFWTDNSADAAYNAVCLRCHNGTDAPLANSHAPGSTLIKCTICHHNHGQDQVLPGKYNVFDTEGVVLKDNFFIAMGTALSAVESGGVTTISYTVPTGLWATNPDSDWAADLANLADKTEAGRGAMLVPSISWNHSRWPVFEIESIDTTTGEITVKGDASTAATELKARAADFGIFYGQQIRSIITYEGNVDYVQFFDNKGNYSFINQTSATGLCQICHSDTNHFQSTLGAAPGGDNHNPDSNCSLCHKHNDTSNGGFAPSADHATFIADDNQTGNPAVLCSSCHTGYDTAPESAHSSCAVCHGAIPDLVDSNFPNAIAQPDWDGASMFANLTDAAVAPYTQYIYPNGSDRLEAPGGLLVADGGFPPVRCGECHKAKPGALQAATHGGHPDNHFFWDSSCQNCHGAGAGAEAVVKVIHADNCDLCHTGGTYNATTNGIGAAAAAANGIDGDAGLAEGDAGTWASTCTTCHAIGGGSVNAASIGGIHHDNATDGVVVEADCAGCHGVNNHEGDHTARISDSTTFCVACHTSIAGGGAGTGAPVASGDPQVHDMCTTCHGIAATPGAEGLLLDFATADTHDPDWIAAMPNGGAGSDNGGGDCSACHGAYFDSHDHGLNTPNYTTGHDVSYDDLVDRSQNNDIAGNACAVCHTNDDDGGGTSLDSWTDILGEHVTGCGRCHSYSDDGEGTPTEAQVTAAIAGTGVTCITCHVKKDHGSGASSEHGGHEDTQFVWAGGCENCHGAGAAAEAVVSGIHADNCDLCHTTGGPYSAATNKVGANGDGDATKAEGDAGTWASTCVTCHNQTQVPGFHGVSIAEATASHQLSSDTSGGIDCESCHNNNVANEQLTPHMGATDTPAQCATICHGNTTPSNTSAIVAKTVIDDVTFNDPAPNNNDTKCEDCHAAKGDYKLHGLSDDDSVADGIDDGTGGVVSHNNLGGSKGSWATIPINTIPSNRAVSYSGKIDQDTYGGLVDDDYNCADCHAADRASFTSLEAMRVHTIMQGSGNGNCLTCHGAGMVSDEIALGVGGTTIECEDCHSIANGNGLSGKKMYQYDGVRHHKTVNAQTGKCTMCHADPRPADIPSYTDNDGYAGTAVNNGGPSDGGWQDGFDDDFNIGYTHPGGMPTQMACRLCHTNYETYTVDVKAENDVDIIGNHDGADNVAVLSDSGAAWTVDEFIGKTILNITDGSSGTVTGNTVTTITASLDGGTDDNWDTGDTYEVNPTPWDTTELKDIHGYNKSNNPDYSTSGLTIYADNFDAKDTKLTYMASSSSHEIRGALQTTQTGIASHRIDANDGSSKIEVLNYGTCFACHTVQLRHAAPVPDQDYDTPVVGWTATERNTHPHDTLRYSPGRSVFNDFRGTTAGDAWNDHRKLGGFPGWNTSWPSTAEWSRRGGVVFSAVNGDPSFAFFDGIDILGNHDGANNVAVLADSEATWTVDEFVGLIVFNTRDGSSGTITGNTETTITAILSGGTDNDWDTNDLYQIDYYTSLAAVPVETNLNDLESLPGMAGTQDIRIFASGLGTPVIDDITITVAQWTGSEVYVEATSILGAVQDFSFTYTGVGGPCNTTMTWDIDHYEGNCVAASGHTGTDTVTVYNNTTPAPDEKTRSLTDLTVDPTVPVLTSFVLADNDSTDPALAEAGYTNAPAGEVQVTLVATNNPTKMKLVEDPDDFDSIGWSDFDTITAFTLSAGNGSKTIRAKVMNGAGESNDLSYIIVLDTTPPVVPSNALTAPNGREQWTRTTVHDITWNSGAISDANLNPANAVFLKYSWNSGASWPLTIASNENNDGAYSWTVNYSITNTARVRLIVRDRAGNESSDDSDNDFSIMPPYIVTNTSDSGGGSLRQVLTNLLTAGGNNTIWFDIPDTDPNVINGTAVINVTGSDLPLIDQDNITIDGSSQTALQGDDNPYGPEIRIHDGDTRVNGFNITGESIYFESLQITGFDAGIISTGLDTTLEYNHLGISSDTGGYANGANGVNARLYGQYPNVYNENYISCATNGMVLNNSTDAWVDGNIFGLFPDGTPCANGNYTMYSNSANDAYISDNVFSGSNYGIFFNGTSQRAVVRGNQIGVRYGVEGEHTVGGLHDGSNNVATLQDSTASWTIDEFVGSTIQNRSDGSSATITANTATTITAALSGGAENDWDANDVYLIVSNDDGVLVDSWASWTVDEFAGKTIQNSTDGSSGTITANTATTITAALSGGTDNDWDAEDSYVIDTWTDLPGPTYGFYVWSSTSGGHTIGGSQVATADDNLRHSNVFGASDTGIYFHQAQTGNHSKVYGNFIGTNPEEDESFPASIGIFARDISGAYIGGSDTGEAGNVIANMSSYGFSVYTDGSGADNIGLRRNSFYNNGNDTGDDAIYLSTDGNSNITRPTIDSLNDSTITVGGVYGGDGGTQNGDIVDVYLADFDGTEYGEGKTFITSGVVALGETTVNIDISGFGLSIGDWLTVTRTSHWPATPNYQTSAFSEHARIPGLAIPTLAWTGEAGYTVDGVEPPNALSGSNFTFKVDYTDTDNDRPLTIEVWIDENDNGTYEDNEKFAMSVDSGAPAAGKDGDYANGERYTLTKPVYMAGNEWLTYRFHATDGGSDATGTPVSNRSFRVLPCLNLDVDPSGTYFEAEDFTATIAQGSATLDTASSVAGFNGTGYLVGNGTNTTVWNPPQEEGKRYSLNFTNNGTYRVWLRAIADNSNEDSIFTGLDGSRTGYLQTYDRTGNWVWISSTQAGQPGTGTYNINPGTTGSHTFNLWFRENDFKVDGIYLTQMGDTPNDGTVPSGATVVDPSVCMDGTATKPGAATATMASTSSIAVSMPYTYDSDTDNTLTVDYRCPSTGGAWTNWPPSPTHPASPYTTTITGRTPGETCDVRMTYADPDGVAGQAVQIATVVLANNATKTGTATAAPKVTVPPAVVITDYRSIDVSMPYTLDSNGDNTYTVDYRRSLAGTGWTNWVTGAAHTASPYTTTITNLIPGETYDVRMTYNDADGVNGTSPQIVYTVVLPRMVITRSNTGNGSLRQILGTLIAAGGNDTIEFDVRSGLVNGVVRIDTWYPNLPKITADNIEIDGSSQTSYVGDTNPNGPEVRINSAEPEADIGLDITGDSMYFNNLQITGFDIGVRSTGEDTSIEYSHFGFWSDPTGYGITGNSRNDINLELSGQYANFYNENYISCATDIGLDISGSSDAYVDENFFGMYPNGTACANTNYAILIGSNAVDPGITDNVIIGDTADTNHGIYLDGSSTGAVIRSNQIGVYYKGGTHNFGSGKAVLTDTGSTWTVNEFVGDTIANITDGSSGTVTANTATTITAALSGGTENDWDYNDIYEFVEGGTHDRDLGSETHDGADNSSNLVDSTPSWLVTGTHNSGNNYSYLRDTGADWVVNEFIGRTIRNLTDGSSGTITGNTTITITATLSGGVGNDWDINDVYETEYNLVNDTIYNNTDGSSGTITGNTTTTITATLSGGTENDWDSGEAYSIKSNDDIMLEDPTATWTVDEFVDNEVFNITDGSSGMITGNTATTITATLRGGAENDWDSGDTYSIGNWTDLPGPYYGIYIASSTTGGHTIGGSSVASADARLLNSNVIGANGYGIYIADAVDNTINIHGNFIGTNPEEEEIFTGGKGVFVDSVSGVVIGGGGAGEAGNVIANMGSFGVKLTSNATNIDISQNSFYNNGDEGDDDAIILKGGNNGTARPDITAATTANVTVDNVLSGETVEVYKSDCVTYGTCSDTTIFGEGMEFVGSAVSGGTSVSVPVAGVSNGDWVTALRIQADGDTSPFSINRQVPF